MEFVRPFRALSIAGTVLAGLAVGCGPPMEDERFELRSLDSPAGAGSGEPNLAARDGRVFLSWLEPAGEGVHALRFAVRDDTAWSRPRTIAAGSGFFVNWADFPSVAALPDGRLAAHWLVRSGPGRYAYDVHIATSADGGETWSPSVVPHRDGTETEHGFASLFPWHDGTLAAVWLDGRNFAGAADDHGHGSGADMTLRFTTIGADGAAAPETLLDPRICECCQTSAALTARGPIVVYRDRSTEEVRDISIVRFADGAWTAPRTVHRDGWQITGCPVNGPAAAAEGDRVAVAWFTAANDSPRVHVAFSADAGASFAVPARVDDGDPIGRVDLVLLDNGDALVSWVERVGEEAEIRLRRVSPAGARGTARTISGTAAARASGFPRMVRNGDELVIAWTEAGDPSHVRTAVARLR
jgi:hypothetical protein